MTSKLNQRAKRKNNFLDAKNEPNMKALKKEDIIAQFNVLQAKYNILESKNKAMEKENKTHIEAIYLLEETVKILKEKINAENRRKKFKQIIQI